MPFPDVGLDRVFSGGVVHFWEDRIEPLREVHRVLHPGGLASTGSLDLQSPPKFALTELGFHLRSAEQWANLYREARFSAVETRIIESDQTTPDGAPVKRFSIRVKARH